MMRRYFRALNAAVFVGSTLLGFISSGCGRTAPTVRQQAPTADHPRVPQMTAEHLQNCVKDYGNQLEPGSWAFSPKIKVDQERYIVNIDAGEIPQTASDLAACTRVALGGMAIPTEIFEMRPTHEGAAANELTKEQRSALGSPAVAVIVVVGLSELVLEAGAYTILFAISVELVNEAAKNAWKVECAAHYEACILAGGQYKSGNTWNQTRCGICERRCQIDRKWPLHVGGDSCKYWSGNKP